MPKIVCLLFIADARLSGPDLNFIGMQIAKGFFDRKYQSLSVECLEAVIHEICVDFVVQSIFHKKLINKHAKLKKRLHDVNEGLAQNPDNVEKDVQLDTFFVWDSTETFSINMRNVNGLSGRIQLPTFHNLNVSIEFFAGSDQLIHSIDKPIHLVSQPVKVKMDPLSSNRVNFNFYTFENVCSYEVDFLMGNRSTIRLPYNPRLPCPSELSQGLTINVWDFFNENPNFLKTADYNRDHQLKLEFTNGKYVLKGFPLVETLSSAEIKFTISDKDDL